MAMQAVIALPAIRIAALVKISVWAVMVELQRFLIVAPTQCR